MMGVVGMVEVRAIDFFAGNGYCYDHVLNRSSRVGELYSYMLPTNI